MVQLPDLLVGPALIVLAGAVVGGALLWVVRARLMRTSERVAEREVSTRLHDALERQELRLQAKRAAELERVEAAMSESVMLDAAATEARLAVLRSMVHAYYAEEEIFGRLFAHAVPDDARVAELREQTAALGSNLAAHRPALDGAFSRQVLSLLSRLHAFEQLTVAAQADLARADEVGDETYLRLLETREDLNKTYRALTSPRRRREDRAGPANGEPRRIRT